MFLGQPNETLCDDHPVPLRPSRQVDPAVIHSRGPPDVVRELGPASDDLALRDDSRLDVVGQAREDRGAIDAAYVGHLILDDLFVPGCGFDPHSLPLGQGIKEPVGDRQLNVPLVQQGTQVASVLRLVLDLLPLFNAD